MSTEPNVVVVTPWYPTDDHPYAGIFVQDTVNALGHHGAVPLVIHVENMLPERCGSPERSTRSGIEVLHLSVPTPPGTSRKQMGANQRKALESFAMKELSEADTVHAHVGIPAGWAVAGLLRPGTRLVVTEHATYLSKELNHVEGLQMYDEVLRRTSELLAVSEMEARRIRLALPQWRRRVTSFGNPVRAGLLDQRLHTPEHLDRWLYVGNFIERKGVLRLVRAFDIWHREHPDRSTHLTLVGSGLLEDELRRTVRALGLEEAVTFAGPVAPDDLTEYLHASDVLVHLSTLETFGLTVVEAAITGLAVLVTTCGGPEETLGEAASEGLVRFVPISNHADDVVAGAHALEASARGADVDHIREDLLSRYGERPFGRRLRLVLGGEAAAQSVPADAPHLVALSFSPRSHRRMLSLVPMTLHAGVGLTLVTNAPGEANACDARIDVIDFSHHAARSLIHLPETVLLRKFPGLVLAVAHRAAGLGADVPGPVGRGFRHIRRRVDGLRRKHQRLADAIHRRVLHRFVYSYIDPWWNARRWIQPIVERLGDRPISAIVMGDIEARPLGWRLAKKFPEVPVVSMPTAEALWALAREWRESAARR